MYTEMVKLKLKCPKHVRFNPVQGEGAIRGNCGECLALMRLFRIVGELRTAKATDGEQLEGEFSIKSLAGG